MSFKIRSIYITAAISAVLTVAAVASAKYKAENSKIVFHAKGPGGLGIEGKSSVLKISEDDKAYTFKTYMNTLDTGIGKRNDHMQQRFKAADFPEIQLTVPKDQVDPKKSGKASGLLKLHGQEKKVNFTYSVDGKHVSAHFEFNIKEHGITDDDLCEAHVCAKPDVKVDVEFDLKD